MVQHPCTPLLNLWMFEWPPDSYLIGLFSANLSPAEKRAGPLNFQKGASALVAADGEAGPAN
jgi:hypothetical protein